MVVTLTLAPGETALLTLDRSAGPAADSAPARHETIAEIDVWSTVVESWDAGELQLITEDRGLGYVTREVRPTTAIERLQADTGPLRPWADITEVGPEVSGIGEYTTTLEVPESVDDGRLLLDLGSTAGGLGSVQINDGPVRGFDTSRPVVDVTDLVRPGRNAVRVRTASSLNNRLLARGYYERVTDITALFSGKSAMQQTEPHPHGLLGPVRLMRELT